MTPEDYMRACKKSDKDDSEYRDKSDRLCHYALGLAGECGEIVDLIKKHVYGKKPLDSEMLFRIKEETGDMLWYLFRMMSTLHFDQEESMAMNDAKLRARYPDGRDKYKGRDVDAERAAMINAIQEYSIRKWS